MYAFLICAVLGQPIVYVAIDESPKAQFLQAELERDWSPPKNVKKEHAKLWLKIYEEMQEFKSRVDIKLEKPYFLDNYPAYRFSKYEKWQYMDDEAFTDNTYPFRTLHSLSFQHYGELRNAEMLKEYKVKMRKYYEKAERDRDPEPIWDKWIGYELPYRSK